MFNLIVILFLVDLQIIPQWELRQCPIEKYACYSFEQAKQLVQLDLELQLKLKECEVCETILKETQAIVKNQEEIINKLNENIEILTIMYERRVKLSETQALQIQKLEKYNVFGKAFPAVISIIIAGVAGGFVAGYFLGSH